MAGWSRSRPCSELALSTHSGPSRHPDMIGPSTRKRTLGERVVRAYERRLTRGIADLDVSPLLPGLGRRASAHLRARALIDRCLSGP
jgi:hypothetical protein